MGLACYRSDGEGGNGGELVRLALYGFARFQRGSTFHLFFPPDRFYPDVFQYADALFFGPQIEWRVGTKRFVFFYLSCGVGAGLLYELVAILMMNHYMGMLPQEVSPMDPLLAKMMMLQNFGLRGADSAVFGLILAYGVLFAERTVQLLIPPIPIKAKYIALICVAVEVIPLFQARDMLWMHMAPLAGMAVGFGIIIYWKKKLNL